MNNIAQLLDMLKNPIVTWGPLGLCVLVAIIIFFINFKKKNGLIYVAIPLILIGALLLSIKPIASVIVEQAAGDYKEIVDTILVNILKEVNIIGIVYLAVAVVFIVITIIIKTIIKNKAKTIKEEAIKEEPIKEEETTTEPKEAE